MPGEHAASAIEARAKEWARENVIERVLLRQAALADPETSASRSDRKSGEATPSRSSFNSASSGSRFVMPAASLRHGISDVVEYYRQHRETMAIPESVRAAHIIKNVDEKTTEEHALAAIRVVEERIKSGESFESVADEASDCPGNGGDLGWFPREQMVPEFDAVVFALKPGEISPVFRTAFGFHIAKVSARAAEHRATFDEARPQIERLLMTQKHQSALERLCDYLRARATVEESG